MNWALGSTAPLIASGAVALTAVLAQVGRGHPRGRLAMGVLYLAIGVALAWLSALLGEHPLAREAWFQRTVLFTVVLVVPLIAIFSVRFGQATSHTADGGPVAIFLASLGGALLLAWVLSSSGPGILNRADGELVVALAPGPARATAVALLLVGCYSIVRLQAVVGAARRAGLDGLSRAVFGPLFAGTALVLVTSQLLLYGALPMELLALGSLVLVPTSVASWPLLLSRSSSTGNLPESAALRTSSLLLLGLGLFLVALAATGQIVHQFFPDRGLTWFRYGGTTLLLIFALLSLVPAFRRPLSERFERNLYASRWDFRKEWARANQALVPGRPVEELIRGLQRILEDLLGPSALSLWIPSADGAPGKLEPVTTGSVPLKALDEGNPLYRLIRRDGNVVVSPARPGAFDDLPAIVENLDLVDEHGFRHFSELRNGEVCFAILGLAPPKNVRLDRDQRELVANLSNQLAGAAWVTLVQDGRVRPSLGQTEVVSGNALEDKG